MNQDTDLFTNEGYFNALMLKRRKTK